MNIRLMPISFVLFVNCSCIGCFSKKDISSTSDEELSALLSEEYLTYKVDYEKQHEGEDGTDYARQRIMEEYGLTEEEWEALYQKFVQEGYLDRAAQKLDLGIDYLIKTDHQK